MYNYSLSLPPDPVTAIVSIEEKHEEPSGENKSSESLGIISPSPETVSNVRKNVKSTQFAAAGRLVQGKICVTALKVLFKLLTLFFWNVEY